MNKNHPIKVLYVLSGTSIQAGAGKSFLAMIDKLVSVYGIQPIVACPNTDGLYNILNERGIKTVTLNSSYRFNVYPKYASLKDVILYLPKLCYWSILNRKAYNKLKNLQSAFNADIIHTNVGVLNIGYKVAKNSNTPHVYHLREYQDKDFGLKIIPSLSKFKIDLKNDRNNTICITKDIQSHFELTNWASSFVVYNGIVPSLNNCQITSKDDYILFAGRVNKSKGTLEVVKAFVELKKKHSSLTTKLLIAGECKSENYVNAIKEVILANSCEDQIELLGERKDISDLMQKSKAIVVSSPNEGFGRITAEAMYNRCLVIGRNTAGTKEQFDNGLELTGNEIGLRYHTTAELVECLKLVITESYDKQIIDRAYHTVKSLYSEEYNASCVYSIYINIINKNNKDE